MFSKPSFLFVIRYYVPPLVIVFVLLVFTQPGVAQTNELDTKIQASWDEIVSLRAQGRFAEAIDALYLVIAAHPDDEMIVRQAYNDLVFTFFLNKDAEGAHDQARNALTRFPDMMADTVLYPPRVGEIYDQLRQEMFGSVTVIRPEDAEVSLDGEPVGSTPIHIDLVPVGEHTLTFAKTGFRDHTETINVDPNGRHRFDITLNSERKTMWWIKRGGIAVIAGAVAWKLVDDSGASALPTPPLPPR